MECLLNMSDFFRPATPAFWWAEEGEWLTVTEYFMLRYGKEIRDSEYMVEIVGGRPGELFPLDVIKVYQ